MPNIFAVVILCVFFQGAAMAEGLFLSSHSDISDRFAILDETEQVAFLYLTQQGTQKPEKDAIAYMRISPPESIDWQEMAETGLPPILSAKLASTQAVISDSNEHQFSFVWSQDGTTVALIYNGNPIAFVSISEPIGYSKAVAKENKLTNPWDQVLYDKLFTK